MSIKNRGEKYVEILNFLRREYVKKFGKEAEGLSDTMLKRQAAEQVDEMSKVVPFPEKNITDWTKDRPKTGPKADVKTFPKQKKLTPEPKTSIERLEKELEEMEKLGQPYKDTSVSDFMSDYFDMPKKSKTPATDKMQKMLGDVKLYGDETFDELQIIKDTGKHPRDKKANGGRIGYAEGMSAEEAVAARLPPNYKFLEDADLKRSPEGIVMEGYQDTTTLDMLRDALKKQERRTPLVEYEDGTIYYPDFDEYYNDDGKQVEGPAFWAKPIPKLFEVPKHSERKSIDLANGGRIGFSKGKRVEGIKSLMEKLNEKLSKKKNKGKVEIADDAPVSEKTKLQREFDEFNKRFKEKTTPDTKDLEKARGKYGSGEDLYKILKSEGITMDKAVKEAIDDMPRLSGDAKYDADAVADVMYERLGIDPDTLDQYHLLDVYDNAYQQLIKQKRKSMYQKAADDSLKKMDPEADTYAKELEYDVNEQISKPGYKGVVTEASDLDDTLKIIESQKSEATKLREQYPGISEALLNKIVKDNNPQRKAEVLASLDEVLTMMDKGMDEKQIMDVLRKTTRTKNASGGLNYLMGL
jgi:hypothetical protein